MTCVFDHRDLHSETDSEIRHPVFACVAHRLDLALDSPLAESAGNENRMGVHEASDSGALDLLGIDVPDLDSGSGMDSGVGERLAQGLVGLRQFDVLPDHRDPHLPARILEIAHHRVPLREVARLRLHAEPFDHEVVEPLIMEHSRNPVDGVGVGAVDDCPFGTLVNRAILRRSASGSGRSVRQRRISGWMPIERSSFTECWVGFVLSSPAARCTVRG